MTTVHPSQTDLLRDLEPVVEANLNRHFEAAREWFPHEYVPWSKGRDFDGVLGGQAWEPGQSALSVVTRWCAGRMTSSLPLKNVSTPHSRIVATAGG